MSLPVHEILNIEFLAREIMAGFITGMHSSPYQGFSVEFAEHRSYNPGDSLRHLDWKLLARSDKWFIKKFEEETNLRCQFLIDVSPSMLFPFSSSSSPEFVLKNPNKLQFSLISAVLIMNVFRKQRDAYGLSLFDEQLVWHKGPSLSVSHQALIKKIMDDYLFTADSSGKKSTRLASVLEELSYRIPSRSMIILFSDAWESDLSHWSKTLSLYKHKKSEFIFFHVYHSGMEQNLNFDNRPYRFKDLESGENIRLYPAMLREEYRTRFENYKNTLTDYFQRYRYDYVNADITQGYRKILETYFQKRKYFL